MTDLAPVHDRAAGPVDDPPAGPADDATTAPLPNPGSVPVTERPLVLVGLVTALVALSFLPDGIRWITTPLAFWLPGHALVTAVFGRRLEFGGVRRICLELLLTLATYPILALAVFSLAIPMSHETVAVSTWLFVAGCAAVAEVRQRRGPVATAPPVAPPPRHPAPPPSTSASSSCPASPSPPCCSSPGAASTCCPGPSRSPSRRPHWRGPGRW